MAFTENDVRQQEQAFAAVKEEFSRLNARFDGMLKESGLSVEDLKKSLAEKHDPELERLLNQAKEEAARQGKARVAQSAPVGGSSVGTGAGRGRPGAVRI